MAHHLQQPQWQNSPLQAGDTVDALFDGRIARYTIEDPGEMDMTVSDVNGTLWTVFMSWTGQGWMVAA